MTVPMFVGNVFRSPSTGTAPTTMMPASTARPTSRVSSGSLGPARLRLMMSACASIAAESACARVNELHAAFVRVIDSDTGIDDGNTDARASSELMRLGDRHLLYIALQCRIGIVVAAGYGS